MARISDYLLHVEVKLFCDCTEGLMYNFARTTISNLHPKFVTLRFFYLFNATLSCVFIYLCQEVL